MHLIRPLLLKALRIASMNARGRTGCDYREFRPYVNQHPYGTRFADLVDHTGFVVGKHIGV
jgi:hypothetical protein